MKKIILPLFSVLSLICNAQYDVSIIGEDTLCIGQNSQYSIDVESSSNQYLFRDTTRTRPGGNGNFALGLDNVLKSNLSNLLILLYICSANIKSSAPIFPNRREFFLVWSLADAFTKILRCD